MGEAIEDTKKAGTLHKVGSKTPILGIEIDEFLMGKREGEHIEIPQPYPANHPDDRLAGKTATFQIHVEAVKQQKLPELDDEFAKDCGDYESLEQLRKTIRTNLEEFLTRNIEESYKDQVIDRLLQMHHFEIPEPLIERELRTMVRQKMLREHRHAHGEKDLEEPIRLQEEAQRLQQEFQPEAKRRVKLGLLYWKPLRKKKG